MFETLFKYPRVLARHREGPVADARERFLTHCAEQGLARESLLRTAREVLIIAKHIDLTTGTAISIHDVEAAADRWDAHQQRRLERNRFSARIRQVPHDPESSYLVDGRRSTTGRWIVGLRSSDRRPLRSTKVGDVANRAEPQSEIRYLHIHVLSRHHLFENHVDRARLPGDSPRPSRPAAPSAVKQAGKKSLTGEFAQ